MAKLKIILIVLIVFFHTNFLIAQSALVHEKKIFIAPNGRIYINKSLPVYFNISTSQEPNAKKFLLTSETNKNDVNPLYFANEGKNPITVTSKTDPVTRQAKIISFDLNIDGEAPKSRVNYSNATKFVVSTKTIYGKGLKIELTSKDDNSGVEKIFYAINNEGYFPYLEPLQCNKEGEYNIKYYAVDNVGNIEDPVVINFKVDLTPPVTNIVTKGDRKDNILSPKSTIELNREDNISGSIKTSFTLDEEPIKSYTGPISLENMKDGNHRITYFSVDNVGNTEEVLEKNTFTFYLDRINPEVEMVLEGDQYNSSSNLFISGNTKIKFVATDNFSGVDKIIYSVSGNMPNYPIKEIPPTEFTTPFVLEEKGPQTIIVQVSDKIGNIKKRAFNVYADNAPQNTGIKFGKAQYFNNDLSLLCITSSSKMSLFCTTYDSGVKEIKYSLDGGPEIIYTEPFSVEKEGKHKISFYSVDNVNNVEKTKNSWFIIDNTPPEITIRFPSKGLPNKLQSGETCDAYPPKSRMYLDTKELYSGINSKSFTFSINGGNAILYDQTSSAVMEELLQEENIYNVKVQISDNLGNEAVKNFKFVIKK